MMLSLCGGLRSSGCIFRLTSRVSIASANLNSFNKPLTNAMACCIARQTHQEIQKTSSRFDFPLHRCYRSTFRRARSKEKKDAPQEESENIDDLKALLQDKSLSFTAKFKVLLKQYGVVLVGVHCITVVFWMGIFYFAVSRGFDIVPVMEKYGVFDFLERIGLPASEKLKSPAASNLLAAYLLYEVAKPIRYPVTIVGTIYAVRILRRLGHFKRPPKSTTMREIVQTQGKIFQHQIKHHTSRLQRNRKKGKVNGHQKKNGKRKHD